MPRIHYSPPLGIAHYYGELHTLGLWGDTTQISVPEIDTVYYAPLQVPVRCTVDGLGVVHGDTAGDNHFYLSLYDSALLAPVNRLMVSGNITNSGANRKQLVIGADLTPTTYQLSPGLYFVGFIADALTDDWAAAINATRWYRPNNLTNGLVFFFEDLGAYGAPPAVASPTLQTGSDEKGFAHHVRVSSVP